MQRSQPVIPAASMAGVCQAAVIGSATVATADRPLKGVQPTSRAQRPFEGSRTTAARGGELDVRHADGTARKLSTKVKVGPHQQSLHQPEWVAGRCRLAGHGWRQPNQPAPASSQGPIMRIAV